MSTCRGPGSRHGGCDVGEVLGSVSTLLSVAAFIPGPQQPFVAGAAFAVGLLGAFVGTSQSKSDYGAQPFNVQAQDRIQTVRSNVANQQIVYGTAKIAGPIALAESVGSLKQDFHVATPLCLGEIDGFVSFELGDESIPESSIRSDGRPIGHSFYPAKSVRIRYYTGTADQVADPDTVNEVPIWTSAHRAQGIAYTVMKFTYNRRQFQTGLPNIAAVVRGRKIWDPRDVAQSATDPATWLFSNNMALCILDYLRAPFGLNASLDEIDIDAFIAAANICDEEVDTGVGPETQARYTCDGVIDLGEEPIQIVEKMLRSCAGGLSYSQGKYRLYVGAWVTPTRTLTHDDLAGPIKVDRGPKRSVLFNAVRGTFVDPDENYQPNDFPPRRNSTYEAEDGGDPIFRDLDLPFTQDSIRAQRIGEIMLRKSRQGITVKATWKWTALPIAPFDVINLDFPDEFGWNQKAFRVMSWSLSRDGPIELILQEDDPSSYDWDGGTALTVDPAPNTNLPNVFDVLPPEQVTFSSGSAELITTTDGTVVSQIRVSWVMNDIYVTQGGFVEVQYRPAGTVSDPADWLDGTTKSVTVSGYDTSAFLSPVVDGASYIVRMRSINQRGVPSDDDDVDWQVTLETTVVGKLEPPTPATTFLIARQPDGTREFTWTHTAQPADVRTGGGYRIRYFLGSTTDWDAMTPLNQEGNLVASPYEVNRPIAGGTYTFAIRAVDSVGLESTEIFIPAAFIGPGRLRGALYGALEQDQQWPGTVTSGFVNYNNRVVSSSSGNWTSLPNQWNQLPDAWNIIAGNVSPMIYETAVIDLGTPLAWQPVINVTGLGNQAIEFRYGDALPLVGAYEALKPVVARYAQIRVTVSAVSAGDPLEMRTMEIILDGATLTEEFNDQDTSLASGTDFEKLGIGHFRFASRNLVVISQAQITAIQNKGPGWSWELIDKAATYNSRPAAEFKLYNSAGAPGDAVIDALLRGPENVT